MRLLVVLGVCLFAHAARAQVTETPPAASGAPAQAPAQQQQPGTTGIVPAPMPAVPAPSLMRDRSLIAAELAALEEERAQLGLGGPIALLAVGGGVFVVGVGVVFAGLMASAVCRDSYLSDCTEEDKDTHDTLLLVGGLLAVGGGVAAIVGFVNLLDRIDERRALGRRIKDLRRTLGPQYGLMLGPRHAGLTLKIAL